MSTIRSLRLRVGLDVGLGGAEVRVPGKHLDVSKRSSDREYLPRRIGYESATSGVTRAAVKADVYIAGRKY